MGVYVLRGEFPVFFWMQDHAGVPESYAAAPLFFLFGISRRVLDLVPALGTLALALAIYRTGLVLFGRGAGLLGVLFTTVVSAYVAANYTLARSYYVEHLVVGQVVLLGAGLWLARPLSEPARCRVAIAMGLAGGLGLYFNFQIVDALIPALLALLLVEPGLPLRRAAWLGVGAFLLGSLPFWVYNLTHDWATVATGARFQGRLSGLETARILAVDLLPVVLGVRSGTDQPSHLPGPLAWTIPLIVGGAVLLLLARVVAGIGRLRRDAPRAGEALLLIGIAVTLGVVWYGGYIRVPRYLLPLIPLLALVLARAAQLTWRWTRRRHDRVGGGVPSGRRDGSGSRRHGAQTRGQAPVSPGARGRCAALRVAPRDGSAEGLRLRLLAGPSAHLRGPGRDHRGPAVQRPPSPPHAGGRPVASARIRGPGGRRDLPRLAGGDADHGPRGRGRRVPHLSRLHAAARGPIPGSLDLHRPLERGPRGGREPARRQARHRVVERPGSEGLGLGRGGPRCRAPGERGDARERPRRARPGRPGGDGRECRRRAQHGGGARPSGCRGPLGERRDPDHARAGR